MSENKRPNVLFIVTDDHRSDAIHAYGNEEVETPTIDMLVNNGVSFRNTYITGGLSEAVCAPSRACINTGCHALNATEETRDPEYGLMKIKPNLSLLGETFKKSGYHTFFTGKWHNDIESFQRSFNDGGSIFFGGMSDHNKVPIFDFDKSGKYPKRKQYVVNKYSTHLFADTAIDFISNHNEEQPFFLYLSFTAPHDPREAPDGYSDLYNPDEISLPKNFMEEHPFDNGEMKVRDELLASLPRTPNEVRKHIADYYSIISHMDNRIRDIIKTLKETGHFSNTIIVYTSDHGLALGQHGLFGKQNLYEHSVRIPFIISGSNLPKGKNLNQLVCQYDIFPTLCELVNIPIPKTIEGKSLIPLIHDEVKNVHETIFTVYKDVQRMVCDGQWKYIRYYKSKINSNGIDKVQLFNVREDPIELNDLSKSENAKCYIDYFEKELQFWHQSVNDPLIYGSLFRR